MGSPKARELMQSLGLRTTKDLQGWTINRLARTVTELGKTPAAWEEAAQGATGIENGALLFSWTGQGPGLDAARQGYDVVMCPAQHVYFDMAHSDDPDDWGASWAAFIALRDTVAWDPVPKDEPELEGRIKGVQGAFWSEFTTRDAQMQPMLAPRILGLSMMAWQARGTADPDRLSHLAQVYQTLFDRMGWRHAPA
jgi:hexosaminidase